MFNIVESKFLGDFMATEAIISLLISGKPWSEWDSGCKSIFCLMFRPLGDHSFSRADRAEARRLNVHLFNRHDRCPPDFISKILQSMPDLTAKILYPRAAEIRSHVLSFVPPRPSSWPSVI